MGQILCNTVPPIVRKRAVHVTGLSSFQQCVCVCVFKPFASKTDFLSFFPIRVKWPGQRGDCNSHRDWSHRRFLLGLAHPHLLQCEAGQRAPLIAMSEFVCFERSRQTVTEALWPLTPVLSIFEHNLFVRDKSVIYIQRQLVIFSRSASSESFAAISNSNKRGHNENPFALYLHTW